VNVAPGRMFRPDEDRAGGPPVAILSNDFWQRRFARSPAAIGTQIVFDAKSYTIVGIASAGFTLNGFAPDVYTPLGQDASPAMRNRRAHGLQVWARLRPGAALTQAQAQPAVVGRQLAGQYPETNIVASDLPRG
jgi:hypothetical protein